MVPRGTLKSLLIFGQSFVQHDVISQELAISGISQHKFLKGSKTYFGKQAFAEACKKCNNKNNCNPLELGMASSGCVRHYRFENKYLQS